ncbi:MAG: hypothetical protein ACE5KM_00565 [Planctomycetaceae bacterium]
MAADKKPAKPKRPKIRISKETTFLLKPVRKDGFIDYAAALNARLSKGVTTKNNAAASMAEILGPQRIDEAIRKELFFRLGVPIPPAKGQFFLDRREFARSAGAKNWRAYEDALQKEVDVGFERPWSRREFPKLAAWLDHNEEHLEKVLKAIGRPGWYHPLVVEADDEAGMPGLLLSAPLPLAHGMREIAFSLAARALLAIHDKRVPEAQRDLLACHRLARHVATGFSVIERFVAGAIEAIASGGDVAMAHSGCCTRKQLERYQSELKKLSPLPRMAGKINYGDRLMALDSVTFLAANGPKALKTISDLSELSGLFDKLKAKLLYALIDWNVVLETVNDAYDRAVSAASYRDRTKRTKAMNALRRFLRTTRLEVSDGEKLRKWMADGKANRTAISEHLGKILVVLIVPGYQQAMLNEDRITTRSRLGGIAVALERYRIANGKFPSKLTALSPRYLKKLPCDVFSGKLFVFQRAKRGYLLYSVGGDGKDAGGDAVPPNDDIAVRMNAPK